MAAASLRRWFFRGFAATCGVAALGVAVIGFAHTEAGRPLLRYIPGMGACPLDVATLTAEDQRRVREQVLAPLAGERAASDRRALAFELGRTTEADVARWASEHQVSCTSGRRLELRCADVPAAAVAQRSGFDAVSFDFDEHGKLVTVEGSATMATADGAAAWIAEREDALRAGLGDPAVRRGEAAGAEVARGPLSQIAREYRASDVRAKVVATNSGHGRFAIREFHQLIAVSS